MFECTEGNTEVSDKEGEFAEALAVSDDAIIKVDTEQ